MLLKIDDVGALNTLPVGSVVRALDADRAGSLDSIPVFVRQHIDHRGGDWYAGWGWEVAVAVQDIVPCVVLHNPYTE